MKEIQLQFCKLDQVETDKTHAHPPCNGGIR